MVAYVRTVKTASGATAVQIVWSSRKGSRKIEHLGSAHDESRLELLKAAAEQRLAAGQQMTRLATTPKPTTSRPRSSGRSLQGARDHPARHYFCSVN